MNEYVSNICTLRGIQASSTQTIENIENVYLNGSIALIELMHDTKHIGFQLASDVVDNLNKDNQVKLVEYILEKHNVRHIKLKYVSLMAEEM